MPCFHALKQTKILEGVIWLPLGVWIMSLFSSYSLFEYFLTSSITFIMEIFIFLFERQAPIH